MFEQVDKAVLPAVCYHNFMWRRPDDRDNVTVEIAVDARNGNVVFAYFGSLLGKLSREDSSGETHRSAPPDKPPPEPTQQALLERMSAEMGKWEPLLGIPRELTQTSVLAKGVDEWIKLEGGTNSWEVQTTNSGWRLMFQDGKLRGWRSPDAFFDSDSLPDLAGAAGRWRLSEGQAIEL